jgi:hypothetical protein
MPINDEGYEPDEENEDDIDDEEYEPDVDDVETDEGSDNRSGREVEKEEKLN